MNKDDFRYMRRGRQLLELKQEDVKCLDSIAKRGQGYDCALLVLHGFSSSPAVYRQIIPKINHYDAILCPVLPGHADSIAAFSEARAADWLGMAQSVCNELMVNYKQVDVLGVSLGGLLALHLSQSFKLNRLYLLAPALKLHSNVKRLIKLTRFLHHLGFKDFRNMAGNVMTNDYAELAYRKLPLTVILEILQLIDSYQWIAPSCPVDLFLGEHDAVVDSQQVQMLFDPLANVTIHWLKNSAHVLPLDNDFQQIIQCINAHHIRCSV